MTRLALMLVIGLTGCGADSGSTAGGGGSTSPAGLVKVSLSLNWYPEAEHGGFYAALVHGYFEEEGLQVEIVAGGPGAPVIQEVAGGKATFGVANADRILLGRSQDADVVCVMAPLQHSPRGIMVHKKSGIKNFEDIKDITLAMSAAGPWALYVKKNVPLESVEIVPYAGSVAEFLRNEKFAQQAYVFSEPFVAEKKGGDPHVLMVSELGFNPYTSGLIVRSETIEQQPKLVEKMVRASKRGWQKYLADAKQTNDYIHKQNPEMDLDILEYGAKAMRPLCVDEATPMDRLGAMTDERWKTLFGQLVEVDAVDAGSVDYRKAFTTRFLP